MTKSLKGRRILVTRTSSQAPEFTDSLVDRGAEVIEIPMIEIVPRDSAQLRQALLKIESYDWLIFTSANAVRIFFEQFNREDSQPVFPRICAVGPATGEEIRKCGQAIDLIPTVFQAEGVIDAVIETCGPDLSGLHFLLPRASQARDVLPEGLRMRGAQVDVVSVYDTVAPESSRDLLMNLLKSNPPDLVAFTSSSTVRHFMALSEEYSAHQELSCAVIGPITAQTARQHGLRVVVQAASWTVPDLVEAITTYFQDGAGC